MAAAKSPQVVRLPLLAPRAGGAFLEKVERTRLRTAGSEKSSGHWPAPSTAEDKLLQVGDLARASGKTVRAIHHYEELGLLKPDARSKGRFRLYDSNAVTRVRWIGKLHDLGMSLGEIQRVVEAWGAAETPARAMAQVREMYRAKLAETRTQIAHLADLEAELSASIDYLDTCDSCDPVSPMTLPKPSTDEVEADALVNDVVCEACQLREREAEPDLVAGIVA